MNPLKKNIIFLDIDGVLNYTNWYSNPRNFGNINGQEGDLDPFCIERVNILAKQTNSYIVISSDWRYDERQCRLRLEKAGLTALIIGFTPIHLWDEKQLDKSRGAEIQGWLNNNLCIVNNYVILDDRTDMLEHQLENFVHVNSHIGLSDDNINKATIILSNKLECGLEAE